MSAMKFDVITWNADLIAEEKKQWAWRASRNIRHALRNTSFEYPTTFLQDVPPERAP